MIHLEELDEAVRDMLTVAGPCGIYEVPNTEPTEDQMPYSVLYPMPSPGDAGGTLEQPHRFMWRTYQVLCVGRYRRQAAWMQGRVHEVMVGQKDGHFLHPLTIPGITVVERRVDAFGQITKESNKLWQTPDTYRMKVSS